MTTWQKIGAVSIALFMAGLYAYQTEGAPIFGAQTKQEIMADIEAAVEAYYQLHGSYPQVPENSTKLGAGLPTGWSVNNYNGPYGTGFIVIFEDETIRQEWWYGPEAGLVPTLNRIKQPVVASSTPQ